MIKDAEITIVGDSVENIEDAPKDVQGDYNKFLEEQDGKKILAFLNILEAVSVITPIVGKKYKDILLGLNSDLSDLIRIARDKTVRRWQP